MPNCSNKCKEHCISKRSIHVMIIFSTIFIEIKTVLFQIYTLNMKILEKQFQCRFDFTDSMSSNSVAKEIELYNFYINTLLKISICLHSKQVSANIGHLPMYEMKVHP